jgi:threonylcarbamoyladenosine tRNA methylthiotransferase MtaB
VPSRDSPEDSDSRLFHVVNFGCRASQSEGASIESELISAGRQSVGSPFEADVVVINSCTVTSEADRDVDRLLRRIHRRNPSASVIVTGCYAQRTPGSLARRAQVRYVVGNSHKGQVPRLVEECLDDPMGPGRSEVFCSGVFGLERLHHQGSAGRTRATVKVQDGCNAACSFCIIPNVRGRSRSLGPADAIAEVRDLVEQGYREVVFSGIHLGSWGRDLGGSADLVDLVRRSLDEVPGLDRIRLSSIEPLEVTDRVIRLVADEPRVAAHLHIPMQSGSSRVLRLMRRPYSADEYADRILRFRQAASRAAIGADVMAGFPGEADEDFLETVGRIRSLPLTYLHVFPYSSRPGTAAAEFEPVPSHVVRFRAAALRRLGQEKNRAFRAEFPGKVLEVLVLGSPDRGSRDADGLSRGLSDNFIDVDVEGECAVNRWQACQVLGTTASGLRARTTSGVENDHGRRHAVVVGE